MQQSATGAPAITANATITASNVKQPSSMDHTNISRANNTMKDVDVIHFTSSQQQTVTTTAAQVITVVASSTQSTDMISSQPLVVQVPSGSPYIAVAVTSENGPNGSQPVSMKLEEPEEASHNTYEDIYTNPVYSNGSNSAGQMAYYTADSYSQNYYSAGEVNMSNTYLVMNQPTNTDPMNTSISNNCTMPDRENNQNVITDDEYNKTYQQTRMSVQPQTINWLMQNYETADGVSLPRSTLYSHYQQHCQQNNLEAVNAASFGKLIRSVFVGLRTRRLGTRGNSKYHYYGIRVKAESSLSENINGNIDNNAIPSSKRLKMSHNSDCKTNSTDSQHVVPTPNVSSKEALLGYLGNASILLDSVWPSNVSSEEHDDSQKMLTIFINKYRAHYDQIIQALSTLSFNEIESIWHSFWQPNENLSETSLEDPDRLSLECIKSLTKTNFSNWIAQTDYSMYNSIISNLLLPNLLKPIPQLLTQQIRNFAKCINKWMVNALQGYDDDFIRLKTSAVSALSHMLRRYTSLNHLSTAACAVLKNQQQVNQMVSDLNRVDFKNVQEQASWVCQCNEDLVSRVENSFKAFLQDLRPYERWSLWCEEVLGMCLPDDNIASAKQFFFKWEFYSSLVMRDLTLRSAQSFGSFHLIRLLYDEYIFYLIEQRIAKSTGTTPLQMLGELASNSIVSPSNTILNPAIN